ncbi:MAG: radical SAM protein [Oscillospiraceae bacterium]|nr:radical SAM protein [Oscillospiraceae bacterium]
MIGDIMSISRLRMGTDGEGVSTLITLHGCPLSCKYCINDYCHDEFCERSAYTPEKLVEVLKKDDIYFKMSGGGIVFGGGEPLLQSEFIAEVFRIADSKWKKRIETSLNVPWENIEPLLPLTDEWIIDIKDIDEGIYRKYTGCSNAVVKENLLKMKEHIPAENMKIRVPYIPDYNTEKNVEKSVKWVRNALGIEAEQFGYFVTEKKQ